ncbi:MAG: BrnT family toxin [Chloroflexota bacterium]
MKLIWDRRKNEANIEKHGLDFADAYKVFESPMMVGLDERKEYGEDRWIGIGLLESARVVVIVFTEPEEDTIRVISFRKATTEERKRYEQEFKNQFGSL